MLANFHFLRPWWFLALIPSIMLWLWWWSRQQAHSTEWSKHCDPHLLAHLLDQQPQANAKSWLYILLACWFLAVLALGGPTWSRIAQPVYQKTSPRIIALDVSQSMNATDIAPSRLQRAKYKILDLLKAIHEGQTGMIVFSSRAFVVSPLTTDSNTIASQVPILDSSIVPVQGSDFNPALNQAAKLITQAGFNQGEIILVSDSSPDAKALDLAQKLAKQGITTSILAIGTEQGGPVSDASGNMLTDGKGNIVFANLDISAMSQLAQAGGGALYQFSNDNSDIRQILSTNLSNAINQKTSQQLNSASLWHDEGHWLIWLLLILAALIARKGILEKLC